MIKQNQRKFNAIHILVDALSAVISIVISFLISDSIHKIDFNSTKIKSDSFILINSYYIHFNCTCQEQMGSSTVNILLRSEITMTFGEKVKAERTKLGMSQDELAAKIGVTRRIIGSYENDKSRPRGTERYKKLAEALNVNVN